MCVYSTSSSFTDILISSIFLILCLIISWISCSDISSWACESAHTQTGHKFNFVLLSWNFKHRKKKSLFPVVSRMQYFDLQSHRKKHRKWDKTEKNSLFWSLMANRKQNYNLGYFWFAWLKWFHELYFGKCRTQVFLLTNSCAIEETKCFSWWVVYITNK